MHGVIAIHDMQMNALIEKQNRILIANVGNLLKKGVEDNRGKTTAGLIILAVGFIIQLAPYVLEFFSKKSL